VSANKAGWLLERITRQHVPDIPDMRTQNKT
jgi:hypothetical protein